MHAEPQPAKLKGTGGRVGTSSFSGTAALGKQLPGSESASLAAGVTRLSSRPGKGSYTPTGAK